MAFVVSRLSRRLEYVTSPDGYTWTKQLDEPVLKTSDVPYAKIAMYASSVIWRG